MTLLRVDDYKRLLGEPCDYRHPYGRDRYQFADLYLPPGPGPYPVLVLIHGGCWRAEHGLEPLGQLARAVAEQGTAVWNIEYRRLGNGGGWPATFLDAGAALDHLRAVALRRNLDLSRVVTAGHSAGGHLALWLAGRHRLPVHSPLFMQKPLAVRGAISLAGIPDLALAIKEGICGTAAGELIGGRQPQHVRRLADASPRALTPLGVPHLHIHGEQDDIVPLGSVLRYATYALESGDRATLLALPDTGHFEVVDVRTPAGEVFLRAVSGMLKTG
ncbi:MAG: alpha/beta hydrolase [Caldilineaceae bacterium]|nr:alpha/beta hydrolase [Caldilineaceae bacterium]